ncbi:MAG: hypothetical protein ACD_75C00239G0002, partial [uncultured bacterium]
LAGARLTTIEGIGSGPEKLHPVQRSFVLHGAVQCGFCTPGMVITATEFLARQPHSDRSEMAGAISGNLCRCTGYSKILDAMENVAEEVVVPEHLPPPAPRACSPAAASTAAGRAVFSPGSMAELWVILSDHPEARVFAGGTDLLIWLRGRRIDPPSLINLAKIETLRGIGEDSHWLRIGAGTSHAALLDDPRITTMFSVLSQALQTLGSPHIRRMGTIGGNIVTASPAGDTLPPLQVLDAEVELCSVAGMRRMVISDFILAPGKTALRPGEILTAVFLPKPADHVFQHFEKVGLRSAMACAIASLAAVIGVSPDGRIESARLAWGSVGPTVARIPAIEAALIGETLSRKTLESVIPLVATGISPLDDVRASTAYRRLVAGNLLLRLMKFAPPSAGMQAEGLPMEKSL